MNAQHTPDQTAHPHQVDLARLRKLATRMDNAYRLPIVGVRIGWDAILGLVPGIGDALALAPSVYIISEARRMGTPGPTLFRMGANAAVDLVIGAVPLVGDLFDIGWRSKTRNVDLLEAHLQRQAPDTKKAASLRPFPKA
ncbi:DUF4112 domain containing protein [Sulfitobacter noctilucae]|uniref:DUF4112 domain-containing protein n=1 Tax=Sulfitobacter noctilucae TaxID=1342302 RepID=UPI0004681CFD|nr:DUF4112 domain-containing protein [Sulfitobacter noctilucae]KIN61233.1 DUF4112 domain containing protein [Sulfitobacter noctilucae]